MGVPADVLAIERTVDGKLIAELVIVLQLAVDAVGTEGILIVGTGIGMETAGEAVGGDRGTEIALRTTRESLAQLWFAIQPVGYRRTSIYVCLAVILVDVGEMVVGDAALNSQSLQYRREFLADSEVGIDTTVVISGVTGILRLRHRVNGTSPGRVTTPLAILALHGEGSRRQAIDHIPQLGRTAWSIRLGEHTQEVHLHGSILRENHIHIHAQVALHIFIIGRISLVGIRILHEAIVILQVEQGIVLELLATARKRSVEHIGNAVVAEGFIHPVNVRIEIRIFA